MILKTLNWNDFGWYSLRGSYGSYGFPGGSYGCLGNRKLSLRVLEGFFNDFK